MLRPQIVVPSLRFPVATCDFIKQRGKIEQTRPVIFSHLFCSNFAKSYHKFYIYLSVVLYATSARQDRALSIYLFAPPIIVNEVGRYNDITLKQEFVISLGRQGLFFKRTYRFLTLIHSILCWQKRQKKMHPLHLPSAHWLPQQF